MFRPGGSRTTRHANWAGSCDPPLRVIFSNKSINARACLLERTPHRHKRVLREDWQIRSYGLHRNSWPTLCVVHRYSIPPIYFLSQKHNKSTSLRTNSPNPYEGPLWVKEKLDF